MVVRGCLVKRRRKGVVVVEGLVDMRIRKGVTSGKWLPRQLLMLRGCGGPIIGLASLLWSDTTTKSLLKLAVLCVALQGAAIVARVVSSEENRRRGRVNRV